MRTKTAAMRTKLAKFSSKTSIPIPTEQQNSNDNAFKQNSGKISTKLHDAAPFTDTALVVANIDHSMKIPPVENKNTDPLPPANAINSGILPTVKHSPADNNSASNEINSDTVHSSPVKNSPDEKHYDSDKNSPDDKHYDSDEINS